MQKEPVISFGSRLDAILAQTPDKEKTVTQWRVFPFIWIQATCLYEASIKTSSHFYFLRLQAGKFGVRIPYQTYRYQR